MKTKRLFSALLALLLVVSLAGCSGNDQETQAPTGTQQSTTQTPTGNEGAEASGTQNATGTETNGATQGATNGTAGTGTQAGGNQTGDQTGSTGGNTGSSGGNTGSSGGNTGSSGGNTPNSTNPPANGSTTAPTQPGGTTGGTDKTLNMGTNTASVKTGSSQSFGWTADKDGTLVLEMPADNWCYWVDNETSGERGQKNKSTDEPKQNIANIPVLKGDVLKIYISTATGLRGNVTFTALLGASKGTVQDPLHIIDREGTHTIRVPAGQSMYVRGHLDGTTLVMENASSAKLTIVGKNIVKGPGEGTIRAEIPKNNSGDTSDTVFIVENTSGSVQSYAVRFEVPLGTVDNPAQLVIGQNTAAAGSGATEGYLFTWTPTASGTLTLTFPSGQNWMYRVDYMNAQGGSVQKTSEDDGATNIIHLVTQDIKRGESVKIEVAPTDSSGNIVEGSVTFTAAFG